MTDDRRLRAIIADARSLDHAAEERPYEWTDAQVREIYEGNNEIERLTAGPPVDAELERLARIAAEESRNQ